MHNFMYQCADPDHAHSAHSLVFCSRMAHAGERRPSHSLRLCHHADPFVRTDSIADHGKNTTYNPHSWTESANVIFIDSPVGVGYSYGGKSVNSSPETAEDLYAFIQLL